MLVIFLKNKYNGKWKAQWENTIKNAFLFFYQVRRDAFAKIEPSVRYTFMEDIHLFIYGIPRAFYWKTSGIYLPIWEWNFKTICVLQAQLGKGTCTCWSLWGHRAFSLGFPTGTRHHKAVGTSGHQASLMGATDAILDCSSSFDHYLCLDWDFFHLHEEYCSLSCTHLNSKTATRWN